MLQTSNTRVVWTVSLAKAPLASVNLLHAGVPASEVVWFRRLKPDRQMAALATTRGGLLLDKVRAFVATNSGSPTSGLPV